MAETVFYLTVSLDGFLTGPSSGVACSYGIETFRAVGAVITGCRTYDPGDSAGDGCPDGAPVYALARRPAGDPVAVQYVADVESAVTRARAAAGERDVLVHGVAAARELLRLGLLDAIEVHLVHVLLGRGRRIIDEFEPAHVELRLTRTRHAVGLTCLHFGIANRPGWSSQTQE